MHSEKGQERRCRVDQCFLGTRQEFALRKLRISRVFFKFHGGLKLSNKRSNDGLRFPPQLRRTQKKELFSFLAIFAKNTGHRVTKFYPISRINNTYKFYFKLFSLTQIFFLNFCIYTRYFGSIDQRTRGRAVGRAVDSQTEISGSNPTAAFFFFVFFLLRICGVYTNSANAEGGRFFWAEILRFFSKKCYINYRYDRRFAEDLRPPHFWQTNSNYGSSRTNKQTTNRQIGLLYIYRCLHSAYVSKYKVASGFFFIFVRFYPSPLFGPPGNTQIKKKT